MQASFGASVDVLGWLARIGFMDREGHWIVMEVKLEDFPNEFRQVASAILKACDLAEMFVKMRADGATVDEMDREMRLIAMDGGV